LKGSIVKALSGSYYVQTAEGLITCRARGLFRKTGQSPLVGDWVTITRSGPEGTVETIAPRRNDFVRPAVANVDALVIFASAAIPVTDPFLIDRMTVIAARQGVRSLLCVNKTDLNPAQGLIGIYRRAGIPVVATSALTGEGLDDLRAVPSMADTTLARLAPYLDYGDSTASEGNSFQQSQ
jgi:ribosome biogenesis GTPase